MSAPIAFYCMSSDLYFPGAVALVNSLRMTGHQQPIHLLDCGLSEPHRELLANEVELLEAPRDLPPYMLKTVAPTIRPAETMVLIDVDMVVTRSLDPLLDPAAGGRVVAFKDDIDRFCAEWGELLDLGSVEPRPYVSSGLVVLSGDVGARVLRLWDERQARADYGRSWFERRDPEYPLLFLDQDVLNAVAGSEAVRPGELVVVDGELAPTSALSRAAPGERGRAALRLRGRTQPLRPAPVPPEALGEADVPRDLLAPAQPPVAGRRRRHPDAGRGDPAADAARRAGPGSCARASTPRTWRAGTRAT